MSTESFKDKPGGLVVDYLGLADELKKALATYTKAAAQGKTAIDQEEAVKVMREKYEVCCGIFHGLTGRSGKPGGALQRPVRCCLAAQEHVLAQDDGKYRFVNAVTACRRRLPWPFPHEKRWLSGTT